MSSTFVPQPRAIAQKPVLDGLFGQFWPERDLAARPAYVAAALVSGLLAAIVLPFRDAGIGSSLVLGTVSAVVASADRRLRTPYHLAAAALCTLLIATVAVRDADWIIVLCLLAASGVGIVVLTEGRTLPGLVASGLAVPLAALRGLPWLGRALTASRRSTSWVPAARTTGLSAILVLVFGLLFASADALFASWASAVVPDVTLDTWFLRAFVTLAVGGLTLSGVYVALNPPRVERLALPAGTPVGRAFEWLVPVGLVTALFAVFVVAQLTVMFGGHDYLRRTTGLTYAEYVHQGFGQLTVATVLTLAVVGLAARKAPRSEARDRVVLRAALGLLCLLTLVVVASALYRMHVYEQAYGFTRLRLLVSVFEGWLGLVVVLVLAAGLRMSGRWIPRAVVLTGATALLALAAINPDAYIARHNVDRFEETGKIDRAYLAGLSGDAVPALVDSRLTGVCVPAVASDDDWLEWNLGRQEARRALAEIGSSPAGSSCGSRP